jgi:hypothetical protein
MLLLTITWVYCVGIFVFVTLFPSLIPFSLSRLSVKAWSWVNPFLSLHSFSNIYQRYQFVTSGTCKYYLIWKRVLCRRDLRTLRWEIILGPTDNHRCPYKRGRGHHTQQKRYEDESESCLKMLALKIRVIRHKPKLPEAGRDKEYSSRASGVCVYYNY